MGLVVEFVAVELTGGMLVGRDGMDIKINASG